MSNDKHIYPKEDIIYGCSPKRLKLTLKCDSEAKCNHAQRGHASCILKIYELKILIYYCTISLFYSERTTRQLDTMITENRQGTDDLPDHVIFCRLRFQTANQIFFKCRIE